MSLKRTIRIAIALLLIFVPFYIYAFYYDVKIGIFFVGLHCFIVFLYYAIRITVFNHTSYYKITHNSYFSTMYNTGKRGEYKTYVKLREFEKEGCKFLFNLYIPLDDGRTTEIDVLLICNQCIFVVESKNFSGWIFGNEKQRIWTQVLMKGKGRSQKEHFYNPIWQNRAHCLSLARYIPERTFIQSVVLFSNRCTFKDVTVNTNDVILAHRRDVKPLINKCLKGIVLNDYIDVEQIYNILYPFSQVSDDIKRNHIEELIT